SAGVHKVVFNAEALTSGVYFYRLQSGNYVETKKMMLVR
ncbi:MAG: T9SS type A sorting domain-containing protein, partial [Bacteroidota bacterium]|nr:T9SS type A sorting domain-containing protein [Bacteroidota bacterium]